MCINMRKRKTGLITSDRNLSKCIHTGFNYIFIHVHVQYIHVHVYTHTCTCYCTCVVLCTCVWSSVNVWVHVLCSHLHLIHFCFNFRVCIIDQFTPNPFLSIKNQFIWITSTLDICTNSISWLINNYWFVNICSFSTLYLTLWCLHTCTITILQIYYTVLHLSTMLSHINVNGIHTLLWLQYTVVL